MESFKAEVWPSKMDWHGAEQPAPETSAKSSLKFSIYLIKSTEVLPNQINWSFTQLNQLKFYWIKSTEVYWIKSIGVLLNQINWRFTQLIQLKSYWIKAIKSFQLLNLVKFSVYFKVSKFNDKDLDSVACCWNTFIIVAWIMFPLRLF